MRGAIPLILSVLIYRITSDGQGSGDAEKTNYIRDIQNCGNDCIEDGDNAYPEDNNTYYATENTQNKNLDHDEKMQFGRKKGVQDHVNQTSDVLNNINDLFHNNAVQIISSDGRADLLQISDGDKKEIVVNSDTDQNDPIISINGKIIDNGWVLEATADHVPIRVDASKKKCTTKIKIEHCNITAGNLEKKDCKLVTIKGRRSYYVIDLPIRISTVQTLDVSIGGMECGHAIKQIRILVIHKDIVIEGNDKKIDDISIKSSRVIMERPGNITLAILASAAIIMMMISLSTCIIITSRRKRGSYTLKETRTVTKNDCECGERPDGQNGN